MSSAVVCAVFVGLYLAQTVLAHGGIYDPPQRGIVCPKKAGYWIKPFDELLCKDAPNRWDWDWHFPAGVKNPDQRGSGLASQKRAAGGNWTPYDPKAPGFRFRAGVCGDQKGGQEAHRKGGMFYYPKDKPIITGTYQSGGVFTASLSVNSDGHHNGFIEFIICDVSKCPGGDISEQCLRSNACQKMDRVKEARCENGSKDCAPIDPKYPSRWFLPCAQYGTRRDSKYLNIKYKLPAGMACEHCVVQWYWASANQCNPPGYKEYFLSEKRPKAWGSCKGQSRAEGGYAKWLPDCGGKEFTEEYYSCIDVKVTGSSSASAVTDNTVSSNESEMKDLDTRKGTTAVTPTPSPSMTPSKTPEAVAIKEEPVSPEQTTTDSVDSFGGSSVGAQTVGNAQPTRTPDPSYSPTQEPSIPTSEPSPVDPDSPLQYAQIYIDGEKKYKVRDGDKLALPTKGRIAMEAVTRGSFPRVYFKVQGERDWVETRAPYFWWGNTDKSIGELKRRASNRGKYIDVEIVIWRSRVRYNMKFQLKM